MSELAEEGAMAIHEDMEAEQTEVPSSGWDR